jgi:disulfide bond formation protein DsbB
MASLHSRTAGLWPQRTLLVVLALVCVGLVGGAVYVQQALGEYPCPLCIIIRYLLLAIAVLALVAVILPAGGRFLLALPMLAAALVGFGVAARLVYLQSHPAASCGIDVFQQWTDASPLAQRWPTLFQATGMCGDKLEPILGLPLTHWTTLAFALIALGLLLGCLNHLRSRRRARGVQWSSALR